MKHRARAETLYHHFHQLNDTGDNGNEKDKAQETEVNSFNTSALGSQHVWSATYSSPAP